VQLFGRDRTEIFTTQTLQLALAQKVKTTIRQIDFTLSRPVRAVSGNQPSFTTYRRREMGAAGFV
jgi:hypothetical protein